MAVFANIVLLLLCVSTVQLQNSTSSSTAPSSHENDVESSTEEEQKAGCDSRVDVVFILDESGSIWPEDFLKQRQFLVRLVEDWTLGPDAVQVGLITFSYAPTSRFFLGQYHDKNKLIDAVNNVTQTGGGTYTNFALERLHTEFFKPENGARSGVGKMSIIITDGESYDTDETAAEARMARSKGITLVAIGVGENVDSGELQAIASINEENKKLVFSVRDFDALDDIRLKVTTATCPKAPTTPIPTTQPPPPQYGPWEAWNQCNVTCGGGTQARQRQCIKLPVQVNMDCLGESIQVRECNTAPCPVPPVYGPWKPWSDCNVTCGVGIQSRQRDCLKGPGTIDMDCIGQATQTRTCNVAECPKPPKFGPWKPWTPCPVTCGAGLQSRQRECIKGPGTIQDMECVGERVQSRACNIPKCPPKDVPKKKDMCCNEMAKADIVFVSDSAHFGGIRGNRALNFIHDVVSDMPLDDGRVRTALVSNKCLIKMGYYLDTYTERAEVMKHLHNLPGDDVVQPMLEEMRTVYFDTNRGGRLHAKKVAVLVIDDDAKLSYKTMDEILKVKMDGIEIFVVAMAPSIDDFKLHYMASEPKITHMFKLRNDTAREMDLTRRSLSQSVCQELKEINEISNTLGDDPGSN